ncbi:MAG: DUF1963 domain-containing protein, partial [Myxococcota bacterium]
MKIELDTYHFEIDPRFQGRQTEFQGGSVWVPPPRRTVQPPIFNFALSEVKDLEEIDEVESTEDYVSAVRTYFDIKRPDVLSAEDSERVVGELRALVRHVRYSKRLPGSEPVEVFALFVNLRLDDEFMQEFSADCPWDAREEYEALFWAAIESYRFKGGAREAIDIQEAARADMYARMDALAEKAEAILERESPEEPAPFTIPEEERCAIEGVETQLQSKEWFIGSHSRTLVVKASFLAADLKAAKAVGLLDESSDERRFDFDIEVRGVYETSGPSGRFLCEDGTSKDRALSVATDGFEYGLKYGLDFNGVADFREGWVSLQGYLGKSYDEENRFPIDICFKLDPKTLNWSDYSFRSIDELKRAPAESVVRVHVITIKDGEDLSVLADCTNLENLFLRYSRWGGRASVELPEGLWALKRLKGLVLQSIGVKAVPDLSHMEELEHLDLSGAGAEIDPSVWLLPKLSYLNVSGNGLREIPDTVELPELSFLELEDNQLRSIPESILRLPKLRRLKLEKNPLESLPEIANTVDFTIDLDIRDKRRLLDFEYLGADGTGLVAWDDEAYYARSSSSLRAAVDEVIAEDTECEPYAEALRFLVKRGVGFSLGDAENYSLLGNHRVGGMPDLPPSIPYPRFEEGEETHAYEFLGQIDCAAVAPMQDYLPRTGFLFFFLSTIHDVYGGDGERVARVFWFDGPREELVSGASLAIAQDEYFEMMGEAGFRAEAAMIASPPEFYAASQNPHLFRGPAQALEDDDDFLEVAQEVFGEPLRDRYEFDIGVGTYGFTQHEDPEHSASLVRKGAPEDWVILYHVKSRGDFQWGDAGDLFFVIHKSDLAQRDFSR